MSKIPLPISLAGAQLGAMRHICAFFSNDDEEYAAESILPAATAISSGI
jgi:hypothetical protein